MMSSNLSVIANVKQLRTGGSFRILLPFFRTSWGDGFLNSAIFNSFHSQVEFGTILEGLRNFGGGVQTPNTPIGTPLSLEACQERARFQRHRDASCHQVFFFLQGKAPKEIHAILT